MNAGRLATVAVVLVVAVVAGASLADTRRTGVAVEPSPPAATTAAAERDRVTAIGSLADQLERLPTVAVGELAGRIHRRLPACRWLATDLATGVEEDLTPRGRCPLWLPGWRYAFAFSVEQSANALIVRAVDVFEGTRRTGRIELPHRPTGGAAGTPRGRFALCLRGDRPTTRVYRGATLLRTVRACGPVAFGEEFLFQDGARFRGADGRVALDFGDPQPYVQPAVNGLVVVAARGTVSVYRGRRRIRSFPLPDGVTAAAIVDSDASEEGRTVVLRFHAVSAADIVVFRAGTDVVGRTQIGTVLTARLAPDGRSVAAVVAGVPVVLDATTLAPVARLPIEPASALVAWTR